MDRFRMVERTGNVERIQNHLKEKINNLPQAGIETKAFSKGNEGYIMGLPRRVKLITSKRDISSSASRTRMIYWA